MDRISRQNHPRSNSIGGEEFHITSGSYQQRINQNNNQHIFPPNNYEQSGSMVGALVDLNQSGFRGSPQINRMHQIPSPYLHNQSGRSPSPSQSHHLQASGQHSQYYQHPLQHRGYAIDPRHQVLRNHTHASLECLNTAHFSDSQHHDPRNNLNFLQQQQHQQLRHQHYAASYVLAAPPANTIINKTGDQDLAAAAMENPGTTSQYHSFTPSSTSYPSSSESQSAQMPQAPGYSTPNLLVRAINQVSQSPLRRIGLSGSSNNTSRSNTASVSLLNHISNSIASQNPMRAGHSSLSLASSTLLIEDKLQNEIKRLQSELISEREKNEALNSQLNINSSLMAAFEQSLTTLNTRNRQLAALNDKKDQEIEALRDEVRNMEISGKSRNEELGCSLDESTNNISDSNRPESQQSRDLSENRSVDLLVRGYDKNSEDSDNSSESKQSLLDKIDDLKRKLVEKDRQLTDIRLEALTAAHQLEQLESKMNGDSSLLTNEDELDEGVMVANHSPSDSDAVTDSAHFSEITGQVNSNNNNSNNKAPSSNIDGPDRSYSEQLNRQEDTNAFYHFMNCRRSQDNSACNKSNFSLQNTSNSNETIKTAIDKSDPPNDNQLATKASDQNSCNSSFTSVSGNSGDDARWLPNY